MINKKSIIKNCILPIRFTYYLIIALYSQTVFATATKIDDEFPIIKNVGIIPVQIQDISDSPIELKKSFAIIEELFPEAVRAASRFRLINDDVVKDLWRTTDGRKSLVQKFELNAFVSLTVSKIDDTIRYTARMLSPRLDNNYLIEGDTSSSTWLMSATRDDIKDFVENIAFRLINRLPIDVFVLSIDGQFMTISGGIAQNIALGDEIKILNAKVATIHPANGSWLTFQQSNLGTAIVIEVKENTSVAQISSMSFNGAIKVGAGASVKAINSRKKFARTAETEAFRSHESPVIIPPVTLSKNKTEAHQTPTNEAAAESKDTHNNLPDPAQETPEQTKPQELPKVNPPPEKLDSKSDVPNTTSEEKPELPDNLTVPPLEKNTPNEAKPADQQTEDNPPLEIINNRMGRIGHRVFSTSGAAAASSQIPFYLINDIELSTNVSFSKRFDFHLIGNLRFGDTTKGSFSGINTFLRWNYHLNSSIRPYFFKKIIIGPAIQFETLGVAGEKFGGQDLLLLGASTAFEGLITSFDKNLEWFAHLNLFPYAVGSFGSNGKTYATKSFLALGIDATIFYPRTKLDLLYQWGGSCGFRMENNVSTKSTLNTTEIYIGIAAR